MSAFTKEAPKGKRGLKALQAELVTAKERWGSSCKATTAPKGSAGAPWPVALQRTIPQPENCTWDVWELSVKLVIERKPVPEDLADGGQLPVRVDVPDKGLPTVLKAKIAAKLEAHWRSELKRLGPPKVRRLALFHPSRSQIVRRSRQGGPL